MVRCAARGQASSRSEAVNRSASGPEGGVDALTFEVLVDLLSGLRDRVVVEEGRTASTRSGSSRAVTPDSMRGIEFDGKRSSRSANWW